MRINTGIYKGRLLNMPAGIRPTQNLVRKAIFDILGDVSGVNFLELFAGSGAVSFEALSRGAEGATLVESSRASQIVIKDNIDRLGIQNCLLIAKSAEEAIPYLHKSPKRFDIIFLDPPYFFGEGGKSKPLAKKTLQMLISYDILAPNGFIIVQHFKGDNLEECSVGLNLVKRSKYGDTLLSFYQKE